jgi:hypothetical protein
MHRDFTIIGKISYVPTDTANALVWKEVRVKKADYHIGVYVNDQTGYQISNQIREPLLDQFAEDLDDVCNY